MTAVKSPISGTNIPILFVASHKPTPSPASSDYNFSLVDQAPDYLDQARQHNFTRSMTPPYGGRQRPPSPLGMQIK